LVPAPPPLPQLFYGPFGLVMKETKSNTAKSKQHKNKVVYGKPEKHNMLNLSKNKNYT